MKHTLVRLGEVSLALALLASTSCSSSGGDATVTKPKADAGKTSGGGDDTSSGDDTTPGDDSSSGGTDGGSGSGSDAGPITGGIADAGGDGKTCPALTTYQEATKISLKVTWPAGAAIDSGDGTIFIWLLTKFTGSGNTFSGASHTCRIKLPDIALNGAGKLATGGDTVRLSFDDALWNTKGMPITTVAYTQKGNDPKSTFAVAPSTTLIGLTLPNPETYTWPKSAWSLPGGATPTATAFPDQDGDSKPGITSSALSDTSDATNKIVYPPIGLGVGGSQATVDRVYIVSRIGVGLTGTKDTCTTQHGTATIPYFDNHVIGCRFATVGTGGIAGIKVGADCTGGDSSSQADFVDQSRTIYVPGAGTFTGVNLTDDANCAAAIAALP